jgi:Uri superfamily endonuclease
MRPLPGTYGLVFKAQQNKRLVIGKLGTLNLQSGYYIYVGSAFGPGGLKARIGHHRKTFSRPHWHIDYLSQYLSPAEVWYTYDATHREDHWSQVLAGIRGVSIPLTGFGSSDCRCFSHLYFFSARPSSNYFRRKVHAGVHDHARIFIEKFIENKSIPNVHVLQG